MRSIQSLIALLALLASGSTLAASCGDAVSGYYRLDRDLTCPGMSAALTVVADGAVIDLAGYSLAAPDGMAIDARGRFHVGVRGPGQLRWSHTGIDATESNSLQVWNVDFRALSETGIRLTDAREARIETSLFRGFMEQAAILINASPSGWVADAGMHKIRNNRFVDVFHGVYICGSTVHGNVLEGNDFELAYEHPLVITGETHDNNVFRNKFRRLSWTAVLIGNAFQNAVYSNAFETAGVGIAVDGRPANASLCKVTHNDPKAWHNKLADNKFYDTRTGIELGSSSGDVVEHSIFGNVFNGGEYGLRFGRRSYDNEGRGNTYVGTLIPVEDLGSGNRW